MRYAALIVAAVLGASVVLLLGLKFALDAWYFSGYDSSAPLSVAEVAAADVSSVAVRTRFRFDGFHGQRVSAILAFPREGRGPFPCIVFVHGIGDDKEFMAKHQFDEQILRAGFAVACCDQLMSGERKLKHPSALGELVAFWRRPAYAVNDTRRLIDYLETRPDIASNRIYLCGVSYGAVVGGTAAAFDKRIKAAVLTYGGGNLQVLATSEDVQHELGKWHAVVPALVWYFGGVFDPIKYVGQVSPRPVLIQNGRSDRIVCPVAAEALQRAAQDPKTIIWYEGDHLDRPHGLNIPLITNVLADAVRFIQEEDARAIATRHALRNERTAVTSHDLSRGNRYNEMDGSVVLGPAPGWLPAVLGKTRRAE
jgi:dienelactone hydrolase